jgi:hypothetical protein
MARIPQGQESEARSYPTKLNKREQRLLQTMRDDVNIKEEFEAPLVWSAVDQEGHLLAVSAAAAGDEIAFKTDKHTFLAHIQSVNGTPVHSFPYVSANGLEVNIDDDVTNGITGWELTNGILSTSKAAYTVGSLPGKRPVYFEATVNDADISDITEMAVGWRKAEAFRANVDDYDEMAALVLDTDTNINIETILNNAATTTTDTTIDKTEATAMTLRIEVDNQGNCKFFVDGTQTTVATHKFDSGEVIVPFLFLIAETGDPGVVVSSWEVGTL